MRPHPNKCHAVHIRPGVARPPSRSVQPCRPCSGSRRRGPRQGRARDRGADRRRTLELRSPARRRAGDGHRIAGPGPVARRSGPDPAGQYRRFSDRIPRRDRGGAGPRPHLVAADRARGAQDRGRIVPPRRHQGRGRRLSRPARRGDRRHRRTGRDARSSPGRIPHGVAGPAGLCRLHLGHFGQRARGGPCASGDLGAEDDARRLVWSRPRRPADACGRVQLDLHAGHRPDGPVVGRRDRPDPRGGDRTAVSPPPDETA